MADDKDDDNIYAAVVAARVRMFTDNGLARPNLVTIGVGPEAVRFADAVRAALPAATLRFSDKGPDVLFDLVESPPPVVIKPVVYCPEQHSAP